MTLATLELMDLHYMQQHVSLSLLTNMSGELLMVLRLSFLSPDQHVRRAADGAEIFISLS
jgi:hypothetical protein